MLSAERNELITRSGPGTQLGALLRRYWQPAALTDQLAGERPVARVRLLGETFVLFRDDRGCLGLLDNHCAHRGADLCYGRVEDGGIRCPFHGWLFDADGHAGEPAANPYLYMAAQIVAGLDGIDRGLEPGPSADTPYEGDAPKLPRSLMDALSALRADRCFQEGFGEFFIDYFCRLKEAEISRFLSEVTDWEQSEYFSEL